MTCTCSYYTYKGYIDRVLGYSLKTNYRPPEEEKQMSLTPEEKDVIEAAKAYREAHKSYTTDSFISSLRPVVEAVDRLNKAQDPRKVKLKEYFHFYDENRPVNVRAEELDRRAAETLKAIQWLEEQSNA